MAKERNGILLLLGLLIGWYIAEKGWHRHLVYLALIATVIGLMWG